MNAFPTLPEHLWGLRRLDDLQHRYGHVLHIREIEGEVNMWRLELVHRAGTPQVRIETNHLAPGIATLLAAADLQGFWQEPAEWEKGV